MDRWVARGLHIVTDDDSPRDACGTREHMGPKPGPAGAELLEQPPPSPRTQALLDSDVLQALLTSTVDRCLGMNGGSLEDGHAAHFRTEVSMGDDEPAHLHPMPADTASLQSYCSDDETSATSMLCYSFASQPEFSPTSTAWSEWDAAEADGADRRPNKKRRRDSAAEEEGCYV
jgi:hypothetical protein